MSTVSPTPIATRSTVPSRGARSSFCIFIASRTSSCWPAVTASPGATSRAAILPGMMARTSSGPPVTPSAAAPGTLPQDGARSDPTLEHEPPAADDDLDGAVLRRLARRVGRRSVLDRARAAVDGRAGGRRPSTAGRPAPGRRRTGSPVAADGDPAAGSGGRPARGLAHRGHRSSAASRPSRRQADRPSGEAPPGADGTPARPARVGSSSGRQAGRERGARHRLARSAGRPSARRPSRSRGCPR